MISQKCVFHSISLEQYIIPNWALFSNHQLQVGSIQGNICWVRQGRKIGYGAQGRKIGWVHEQGRKIAWDGQGRKIAWDGQGMKISLSGQWRKISLGGQGRKIIWDGQGRKISWSGQGRKIWLRKVRWEERWNGWKMRFGHRSPKNSFLLNYDCDFH